MSRKNKLGKYFVYITFIMMIMTGCNQKNTIVDKPIENTVPTETQIQENIPLNELKVDDIISHTIMSDNAIDQIHSEVQDTDKFEHVIEGFKDSFQLIVDEVTRTSIVFTAIQDNTDTKFEIPYKALYPSDKYIIELSYEKNIKYIESQRIVLRVNLIVNDIEYYTLGNLYVLNKDIEQESIPFYFYVPFVNEYEIAETGDSKLQNSYIEEFSSIVDTTFYARLKGFNSYNLVELKEGYTKVSEEDIEGFCVYNKDSICYEIDENCKIIQITDDCYKVVSLKSLHSYINMESLSDIYLIGLKNGKVIYMFNIFYS